MLCRIKAKTGEWHRLARFWGPLPPREVSESGGISI